MRKHKLLYSLGAVGTFVGIGAWALLRGSDEVQYRTVPAERGDIAYTVSATGNPNAVVTVQVGTQVSGNIQALFADFNTHVTKGQIVARIDPQLFQARVDQAQANLNATRASVINAQANVQKNLAEVSSANAALMNTKSEVLKAKSVMEDAKVKFGRRAQLASEGILSKEDLDTAQATSDQAQAAYDAAQAQQRAAEDNVKAAQAEVQVAQTQVKSAEAQVQQCEAALAQAQLDLDHTIIRAPVDGIVVARHVDVGQTVAASLQAPTLFDIAQDLTRMQVDTNVSEADVGRVQVGQKATFTVDAYPGRVFQGEVTSIRQAPINVQNVITYDVVIASPNPDLKLFPGMTANVKILVDQRQDALKIPNSALRYRPAEDAQARGNNGKAKAGWSGHRSGNGQVVWVLLDPDRKPRPVPVQLGITDGTQTEVAGGGLKEGDPVIVAAFSKGGETAHANGGFGAPGANGGGGMRRGPAF